MGSGYGDRMGCWKVYTGNGGTPKAACLQPKSRFETEQHLNAIILQNLYRLLVPSLICVGDKATAPPRPAGIMEKRKRDWLVDADV